MSLTGFPASEILIREQAGPLPVRAESFRRPIRQCENCRGMCCYHGAHMNDEQAETVQRLARDERAFFAKLGLDLPEEVIVDGYWYDEPQGPKTALKDWHYREVLDDFPAHWDNTTCVFLTDEGFCSLQILSGEKGQHPWYFKPMICWMHPLAYSDDDGILLYDENNDPSIYPDFPGFNTVTRCGRTDLSAPPAYVSLHYELAFFGEMIGRDLVGEIREVLEAGS